MRVAFILHNKVLFSVHAEDLPVFRLLRLRARRTPSLIEDAKDVLLKLYDADAEYSADALEGIYDSLEAVSARVLKQDVDDRAAGDALSAIAKEEDLNGRIRRNVMDTRRAVSFMMRSRMLNAEQFEEARQILRDIDSLDSHTAFLFDKINFLMDATVGFININQNKIIKIFSVASVALLPPTLIASIYGMNFQHMPGAEPVLGLSTGAGTDGGLGGRAADLLPPQGLDALTAGAAGWAAGWAGGSAVDRQHAGRSRRCVATRRHPCYTFAAGRLGVTEPQCGDRCRPRAGSA